MATDNVELSSGSGGAVIRTKARGNVETPVSMIDVGSSSEALVGTGGVCMPVSGSAASGATASGNPVLTGGQYTNAVVTLDDNDVGSLSIDIRRNLNTVIRDASGNSGLKVNSDGSILVSGYHSENFDTQGGETDNTTCFGLAVPSSSGAVSVKASSVGPDLGLNVFPVGSHSANFTTDSGNTADNTIAFGIAVPGTNGAEVVGGSSSGGLLVNLGSNNDIKLHDGSGQPLSSVLFSDSVRYLGVSTVDSIAAYKDNEGWTTATSYHFLTGSVYVDDNDWVAIGNKETSPLRSDTNGSLCSTLRAFNGDPISTTSVNNDVGLDVNVLNQIEVSSIPSVTIDAIPSDANVGIVGRSAGGLSSHKTVQYPTGSTAGSVTVSSSACTAYSITAFNMTATPIFLKIYDSSSSASSSDTPILTYVVPANSQLSGAGFSLNVPQGIAFSAGLTYRASTVLNDDDGGTAYPTSGDLVLNILYKA
jgi:hypothetical protein